MFYRRTKVKFKFFLLNGRWRVTQGPVSPDPGRDDDPARHPGEPGRTPDDGFQDGTAGAPDGSPAGEEQEMPPPIADWLTDDEWLDWLSTVDPEDEDPENDPGQAGRRAKGGRGPKGSRRGPGQPGSARRLPGDSPGPVGAFATGQVMDTAPGGAVLFGHAEHAAGDDARFAGATDDELTGLICGLDRAEAAACALKHAAVAELIRRSPEDGCELEGPAQMPATWHEFTVAELADALAETRQAAEGMLTLAHELEIKLPGTKAAFRSGVLRLAKVEILARGTVNLTPEEARAVEALVLGRAGRLTPGGLRSAVATAVIQVAPDKARKRREEAARHARVQRWLEDSGNAALMGRELPPADVLAADQRMTWWAGELKKSGVDGDMDQLRALAYMDFMLGRDSRLLIQPGPSASTGGTGGTGGGQDRPGRQTPDDPRDGGPGDGGPGDGGPGDGGPGDGGPGDGGPGGGGPGDSGPGDSGPGDSGPGSPDPDRTRTPPVPGVLPAGFIGCINLTVTLPTLLGLAERPGELSGLGPVDPALARDLARAAAANPKTSYCVTVTDEQGHATGHGCARPAPRGHAPPGDHDPPGGPGAGPGPGFTFTTTGDQGPPGGYGTWRLSAGLPGQPDLLITLDPIALDTCDHRFEARGHDPGVKLRHLTQIRHATCVAPACRRPARNCDFEHNIPYEAGGRTCACNGGPTCRHDHRLKQHPRWKVEQITPGNLPPDRPLRTAVHHRTHPLPHLTNVSLPTRFSVPSRQLPGTESQAGSDSEAQIRAGLKVSTLDPRALQRAPARRRPRRVVRDERVILPPALPRRNLDDTDPVRQADPAAGGPRPADDPAGQRRRNRLSRRLREPVPVEPGVPPHVRRPPGPRRRAGDLDRGSCADALPSRQLPDTHRGL
jgi:hypothetical protein